MHKSIMNSTNSSAYAAPTNQTSDNSAWEESGAMVYIALTVATISGIIMCCTWFIKQRWFIKGYKSLSKHQDENVELQSLDDDEEEEIPLVSSTTPPSTDSKSKSPTSAFTLSASDSDGSDRDVLSDNSLEESIANQSAAEEIAV
jgi:hypothetical protein